MIHVINWFVNILTLGLVSIATITTTTYHVDEPIPELNNLSLTQVFEGGNLVPSDKYDREYSSYYNGIALGQTLNTIENDVYWFYLNKTYNDNISQLNNEWEHGLYIENYGAGQRIPPYTPTVDDVIVKESYQKIVSPTLVSLEPTFSALIIYGPVGTNRVWYLHDLKMINQNTLGIDNLTKEQMDYWFSIYQQAVANNGVYIESNAHLNNNIHLVDVSAMVISFGLWTWLFKFLKGVVL